MAKRMRSGKRASPIVSPNRSRLRSPYVIRVKLRPIDLSVFEDRRTFYPDRLHRPANVVTRRSSAAVVREPRPFSFPDVFRFRVPDKVVLCLRRKARREVMHALDLTRKGAGGGKRRNEWSAVKC